MIKIENKSISGSLILRFGLPLSKNKYQSFYYWLKCNLDAKQFQLDSKPFSGERLNFNMFEARPLTDEEIDYLKEVQGEPLERIMEQLTPEDFIIINFYCKEYFSMEETEYKEDKFGKEELVAIKSLLEKEEIEFHKTKNKTYIRLTPKGRYRYFKNHQKQLLKDFKEKIERKGIDPSIAGDEFLAYIAKRGTEITECSLNKYFQDKGIEYPENTSYIESFKTVSYDKLLGIGENEKEILETLLSSENENTSICLVDVKKLGITADVIKGQQLIKWPSNEQEIKEATENSEFFTSKVGERLLAKIIDYISNRKPKIIIEKTVSEEGTNYIARGIISIDEWEDMYITTINPKYLKKKQSKELNQDQQTLKQK